MSDHLDSAYRAIIHLENVEAYLEKWRDQESKEVKNNIAPHLEDELAKIRSTSRKLRVLVIAAMLREDKNRETNQDI